MTGQNGLQPYAGKFGKCTHCGRKYKLTVRGRVRKHRMRSSTAICGGSGGYPS